MYICMYTHGTVPFYMTDWPHFWVRWGLAVDARACAKPGSV